MSDVLWKLDGVTLGRGARPRLAEVSAEIREGVTAVLGSSGAGKSSLLNLLVGYEKPDQGRLTASRPSKGHSLPVYWVPQNGGLWPHLTALEHLELVMPPDSGFGWPGELLEAFDIGARAKARPHELSEGERARLAVARALGSGAAVLVMDEPLASVDVARVGRYWEVIRERLRAAGSSLVFATHSPEAVLAEADRVICLREGRGFYDGPVADLYWRPRTREEADCLGAANWLSAEEARVWLGGGEGEAPAEPSRARGSGSAGASPSREERVPEPRKTRNDAKEDQNQGQGKAGRCWRPEQIVVERSQDGPLIVQSSRFKGSVAEADLIHEETGQRRRFYHRPPSDGLLPGARVALRALACLLLAWIAGCHGSSAPELHASAIRSWSLPADGASLPAPRALATGRDDEMIVLDTAGRILVYTSEGTLSRQWRMPETKNGRPEGACLLKDGRIAVADTHYHRVVFFGPEGKVVGKLGTKGEEPGQFIYPTSVVQDDKENLYVCEYGGNDRVQKFTADGKFVLAFGGFERAEGKFQRPGGMVWHDGKLFIADAFNNRVQVFSDKGDFIQVLGRPGKPISLHYPYDIAMDAAGALYIIEYGAGRLTKVSQDGELIGRFGTTGRGECEFQTPWGIAVDSKRRVRIADTGNRRIVELRF